MERTCRVDDRSIDGGYRGDWRYAPMNHKGKKWKGVLISKMPGNSRSECACGRFACSCCVECHHMILFIYIETPHVLCVSLCIFDFIWIFPMISLFWMLFPSFPMISLSAMLSPGPASKRPKAVCGVRGAADFQAIQKFMCGCFQKKKVPPKWMVKIMENPILKWDDLGKHPCAFNSHVDFTFFSQVFLPESPFLFHSG